LGIEWLIQKLFSIILFARIDWSINTSLSSWTLVDKNWIIVCYFFICCVIVNSTWYVCATASVQQLLTHARGRMQREKQNARSAITFLITRVHLTSRSSRLWSRDFVRKLDKLQSHLKTVASRHRFYHNAWKATCFYMVTLHSSKYHSLASCHESLDAYLTGMYVEQLTFGTANRIKKNSECWRWICIYAFDTCLDSFFIWNKT